jgi:hypothetical protein
MAWLRRKGKGWRAVWREGGRGAVQRVSPVYPTKAQAAEHARLIESKIAAAAPQGRRLLLPWPEVVSRWEGHLHRESTPRYAIDAPRQVRRWTEGWTSTRSATREQMRILPEGAHRVVRACLCWSADRLDQVVLPEALARRPRQTRRRPAPDLLSDADVAALLSAAAICPGGQAIAHLVATYGHRPQSLVGLRVD